jgi:hypothetical protein
MAKPFHRTLVVVHHHKGKDSLQTPQNNWPFVDIYGFCDVSIGVGKHYGVPEDDSIGHVGPLDDVTVLRIQPRRFPLTRKMSLIRLEMTRNP